MFIAVLIKCLVLVLTISSDFTILPLYIKKARLKYRFEAASFLFYIGLERILYKQVHTVGMVGGIVEVGAPATQIFSAYLHVRGYVPEYVGYEILSVAVGTWQVVGITVFRVKAGHAVSA